jgi:hypothetical protein
MPKKNLFTQKAPLTKRERRYCSCLLDVRSKRLPYNPYAVCTQSVYNSQGVKRKNRVDCDPNYNYNVIPLNSIRALAEEKKISLMAKKGHGMASKKVLVNRISRKVMKRKTDYYKSLKSKVKSLKRQLRSSK